MFNGINQPTEYVDRRTGRLDLDPGVTEPSDDGVIMGLVKDKLQQEERTPAPIEGAAPIDEAAPLIRREAGKVHWTFLQRALVYFMRPMWTYLGFISSNPSSEAKPTPEKMSEVKKGVAVLLFPVLLYLGFVKVKDTRPAAKDTGILARLKEMVYQPALFVTALLKFISVHLLEKMGEPWPLI